MSGDINILWSAKVAKEMELKSVRLKIHIKFSRFSAQRFQKSWNTFLGYFKNEFHAYIPYS